MSNRIALAALLLLVGCTPVGAADDMTAELARFIVRHARAAFTECPPQARQLHPDRLMICATYGASWSRFKSDWEFVLDRFDVPVATEALSAWARRSGRYERQYRVERSDLTVVFDEPQGLILFAYTLEGVDDPSEMPGRSSPGSERPLHVAGFGGVSTPRPVERSRVEPAYPGPAMERRIEGSVALQAVIGKDGTVTELKILSEQPEGHGFAEAALAAVKHWLYEPATLEGKPVDAGMTIYVSFKLPRQEREP